MKKTKKFVSILLALVLTVSSFSILSAVTASAVTDTKVYVEIPDFWGEVKWNAKKSLPVVYCHVYYIYGEKSDMNSYTFATASERCEWEHDNVYSYDMRKLDANFAGKADPKKDESGNYIPLTSADWEPILSKFTSPIKDGADYGIIFCADNTKGVRHQTCDMTMGTPCLGDTMIINNITRERPMNSQEVDYLGEWTDPENKKNFGPKASITSLGEILDGKLPFYAPKQKFIADAIHDFAFNMKVNAKYFTTQRLNELETELGVTAREVYDQYVETYKDLIEEGIANGTLVDKYGSDGTPENLVPTLERVAERLGITIEDETKKTEIILGCVFGAVGLIGLIFLIYCLVLKKGNLIKSNKLEKLTRKINSESTGELIVND